MSDFTKSKEYLSYMVARAEFTRDLEAFIRNHKTAELNLFGKADCAIKLGELLKKEEDNN